MKYLITLTLLLTFEFSSSQTIDPLSKALEIQGLSSASEKVEYKANHSSIFDYIPDFFSKASEEDLAKIFSAPNFERFTVTGTGIIYERRKGKEISKEEISEIARQILLHREMFNKIKKEQSDVMVNNYFDFEEKSILWTSGLVVVFRNKQLTHVLLGF